MSQQLHSDAEIFKPIVINKDSVAFIKKMSKFEYMNSIDSLLRDSMKQRPSPGKKFEISRIDLFLNSSFLKIILFLLIGFLLAWLAVKFWDAKGVFKKQSSKPESIADNDEIDVSNYLDYNELINHSVSNENYRLAIKYYFLQTLLMLSEKELIYKTAGKTNVEYLKELPDNLKSNFSTLIKQYNYVWYGKMNIEEETFSNFRNKFITFQNML